MSASTASWKTPQNFFITDFRRCTYRVFELDGLLNNFVIEKANFDGVYIG